MGVGEHGHRSPVGTEAVQETPCPDGGEATLRQRPLDVHGADPAERHLALRPQLQAGSGTAFRGRRRTDFLLRRYFQIGHPITLGRSARGGTAPHAMVFPGRKGGSHPARPRLRMVTVGIPLPGFGALQVLPAPVWVTVTNSVLMTMSRCFQRPSQRTGESAPWTRP